MEKIIDYLFQFNERLISPIWNGRQAFDFLCLGHVKMSEALGFESYQATPVLRMIQEDTIVTDEDLQRWIDTHTFDYRVFDEELEQLGKMTKNDESLPGGGCFGPLTIVSGIVGIKRMLRYTVKQPQLIKKFVEQVTRYIIELAKREEKEGAQFFWIAEPLASLLVPEKFWAFSGICLKQIFSSVEIPGFLHVCGKTLAHTEYLEETGAQVLSIDSVTDIGKCLRRVDENTIIMGNISPALLYDSAAAVIADEVRRINEECQNYKNFIMSTGCVVMDGTPDENMRQIFDITKDYPIWGNEEYVVFRRLIKMLDRLSPSQFDEYVCAQGVDGRLVGEVKKEYELSRMIRGRAGPAEDGGLRVGHDL